jgi:hypothetical protein
VRLQETEMRPPGVISPGDKANVNGRPWVIARRSQDLELKN